MVFPEDSYTDRHKIQNQRCGMVTFCCFALITRRWSIWFCLVKFVSFVETIDNAWDTSFIFTTKKQNADIQLVVCITYTRRVGTKPLHFNGTSDLPSPNPQRNMSPIYYKKTKYTFWLIPTLVYYKMIINFVAYLYCITWENILKLNYL